MGAGGRLLRGDRRRHSAPAGLGVTYEIDVLKRLVEIPGVEAIKESSWSRARFAEAAAAFGGDNHDVALLSGQDTFILDSLMGGADGAMLGPSRWVKRRSTVTSGPRPASR